MTTRALSTSPLRSLVPTALLLGISAFAATASAQSVTPPTVISTVPYTISTPGKYILGQDVTNASTTTPAITISANNVNLDLNGYFVSGVVGNTASTNDVVRVGDVADVVIKNGTVANDGTGIEFTGSTDPRNYLVENVIFTHCYSLGVEFDNPAVAGVVRYCKFSSLGGGAGGFEGITGAVQADGGVRIEKNTIDTVVPGSSGEPSVGVFSLVSVTGNNPNGSDFSIGNTIANIEFGVGYVIFLDNLTTGITGVPFTAGTNATGNTSVQPGDSSAGGRKNSSLLRSTKNKRR